MGKKRCPSGYNRYIQECAQKTGDFKGCLMEKGWGKLSDNEKGKWNEKAADQCNI